MKINKSIYALIGVLLFAVLQGCSYTSVRQHKDFNEYVKDVEYIVIAPPAVTVEEVTFTGENNKLADKETAIREELVKLAKAKLEARGFKVVDFDINAEMENDKDFAFEVNQVEEAFKQARQELYDGKQVSEEDKAKFNASLGPVVNTIVSRAGADAVLLLHYYGYEKSAGMIAKDIAASVLLTLVTGSTPVAATEGSQVEVALIDGDTGAVLWVNTRAAPVLSAGVTSMTMDDLPGTNTVAQSMPAGEYAPEKTAASAASTSADDN